MSFDCIQFAPLNWGSRAVTRELHSALRRAKCPIKRPNPVKTPQEQKEERQMPEQPLNKSGTHFAFTVFRNEKLVISPKSISIVHTIRNAVNGIITKRVKFALSE
jgi:hypothetical protein